MNPLPQFYLQIVELIQANHWEKQLQVELVMLENQSNSSRLFHVKVTLSQEHPTAPGDLVNEYQEEYHSLEQVQQECLRALRTGRTGV